MKTIYLLRHGNAEGKHIPPDAERNLDAKGEKEANDTGMKIKKAQIIPDVFMSSHANRARQTAEIVAGVIGYPPQKIIIEKGIYHTDADGLLEIIHGLDDSASSVIITGHNPSITHLAWLLSKDFKEMMPTAGFAGFQFKISHWAKIKKNEGELKLFIAPEGGNP